MRNKYEEIPLMITKKSFNIFNYGTLLLIGVLVFLMLAKILPEETFIYILVFAIILFFVRVAVRLVYIKQNRKNNVGG